MGKEIIKVKLRIVLARTNADSKAVGEIVAVERTLFDKFFKIFLKEMIQKGKKHSGICATRFNIKLFNDMTLMHSVHEGCAFQ